MLTRKDIAEDGSVAGYATFPVDDIISADHEWLLDSMSEQVTGTILLQGFTYTVDSVDKDQNTITFKVEGFIDPEDMSVFGE